MNTLTTVIPVYNGEKYIGAALKSVATQTRRPDRVVVIDNCSTDGTREIVSGFGDVQCEWHQNEKNLGLFGNLNRALCFVGETRFLHLLHADDMVQPEFYERCLDEMQHVSGKGLVFCVPEFIDEKGKPIANRNIRAPRNLRVYWQEQFIAARAELRPIYFPGILLKTGERPADCQFRMDLPQFADHVFWAEWARSCSRIIELPQKLALYRFHGESESSRNLPQLQSWVVDEWRAMQLNSKLINDGFLRRWVREQKLKTIFAARCHVKVGMVKGSPDFQQAIRSTAREISSASRFALASALVAVRDFVFLSLGIKRTLPS